MKKLSVKPDLPDCLVEVVLMSGATEQEKVVENSALIAYYYLLRIGEYTKFRGGHSMNGAI